MIDEELAGEIKITVIANGFAGDAKKAPTPTAAAVEEPTGIPSQTEEPVTQPVDEPVATSDDSEELDVPAFIRRKMG